MDIERNEKMEPPKSPYHIRPFPRQPHRGTKELKTALADLESSLLEKVPDLEYLRGIQKRIHEIANTFTDDHLIDRIRLISSDLDAFQERPEHVLVEKIMQQILQIKVDLKHL